ncbi:platelet-derived growth factor D [Nerophis ophidion]|uniref:platelet-derived growth factor D n=1 Tax=Nerophis ophidion TaxID=159077 RepID=UPI002AE0AAF7|nr:platelet-derived growth factor D [Nerophis ophidion]
MQSLLFSSNASQVVVMRGSLLFHLCVFLLSLETLTCQVFLRGNVRRDDLYRKCDNVTVTSEGGVIHSPRYPNSYPRNLLLLWKLVSPAGSRIRLEFDGHFGLEEAENNVCRYDFVEVEDRLEASTIIWGRWCGQRAPPSVNSKSNVLTLTFKSDDYFVAKPGFKVYYSLLHDSPLPASQTNWEAVTSSDAEAEAAVTDVPLSLEDLDRTVAAFDTVEQLLRSLNPDTWRQDLDNIYAQTQVHYRSRAYQLASRHNKVDLNGLCDDVRRYSCTPRNYSVNLREELSTTNAVFFPRCVLVQRCGGNCGCGTDDWNHGCACRAAKTTVKLHEVLKYAPESAVDRRRRRPRARWVLDEVFLTHHLGCECDCPSRPPR